MRDHRIARRRRDLAVERHVYRVQNCVVIEVLTSGRQQPPHFPEVVGGRILRRQRHRLHLDRRPGLNEIEEQLRRHLSAVVARDHEDIARAADIDARSVSDVDDANRFELLQRFAYGWMTDAKTTRHFHDRRQALPERVIAPIDRGANFACQTVDQTFTNDWLHQMTSEWFASRQGKQQRTTAGAAPP